MKILEMVCITAKDPLKYWRVEDQESERRKRKIDSRKLIMKAILLIRYMV